MLIIIIIIIRKTTSIKKLNVVTGERMAGVATVLSALSLTLLV